MGVGGPNAPGMEQQGGAHASSAAGAGAGTGAVQQVPAMGSQPVAAPGTVPPGTVQPAMMMPGMFPGMGQMLPGWPGGVPQQQGQPGSAAGWQTGQFTGGPAPQSK